MDTVARGKKDRFIRAAYLLFAEHGYAGVSLADVAAELGVTKQAVLYHFKTKEALYGAVLEGLASRFDSFVSKAVEASAPSEDKLRQFVADLYGHMQAEPGDARLIARELLDNRDRAEAGRKWYLRPFLDATVSLMRDLPRWQNAHDDELAAAAYQMIGAINYFAISGPTLKGIWGEQKLEGMKSEFLETLINVWIGADSGA